jgi:hypothetical protein
MKRYPLSWPTSVLFLSLLVLLTVAPEHRALGQLARIDNKIPKSVPLEVEFKNYDKKDWWRDLEVKVTNTGKKPIYYLWLILWLDATDQNGKQRAISFKFGDVGKFYSTSNEEVAKADDPAILPGETYVFTADSSAVKFWNLLQRRGAFAEPQKGVLDHGFTSFGDGTGLLAGGTLFSQKKKIFEHHFDSDSQASSRKITPNNSFDFFGQPLSGGCSLKAGRTDESELKTFQFLAIASEPSCISCTPNNCPAPAGYENVPRWTRPGLYQNCQYCNENPYRWVNWYNDGGGCFDTANRCFWLKEVPVSCPTSGDPPQEWFCYEYQLLECQIETCRWR